MNKCNECGNDNADNSKYCSNCGNDLLKQKDEHFLQKPIKKVNYKKVIGMTVGVIALYIAYFLIHQPFNAHDLDKVLIKTSSEINKSCPIMIDSVTRLDNTTALPSKILQYNYTLISMEKEKVDIIELRSYLEQKIINNVRTNPDLKFFRDNKVKTNYYYKDKVGIYLFTISVTPEQYK